MSVSRRHFIKNMGMGLAAVGLAAENLACSLSDQSFGSEKLLLEKLEDPDLPESAPVGVSRLPLVWYKDTARRLKEKVSKKGIDAILLGSDTNMVYFTGCFRGSGERSTWAFSRLKKTTLFTGMAPVSIAISSLPGGARNMNIIFAILTLRMAFQIRGKSSRVSLSISSSGCLRD